MADKKIIKEKEVTTPNTDVKTKEEIKENAPKFETEIKETAVSDVQVDDEDEDTEITKPKKRFKKRYIAAAILLLGVGGFAAKTFLFPTPNITEVTTSPVALGDIENVISISGNVSSAETLTLYSEVDGIVDDVKVRVGDKVKAGEVLMTYDADKIELDQKQAEIAIKKAKADYTALYTTSSASDRDYAKGMTQKQINERLDAITAEIDSLNNQITDKKARMNQTLTDLNKTLYDINQNGVKDGTLGDLDYEERRMDSKKELSESNKQMLLAVNESIQEVQYAINNDPEIEGWNRQITALKEEQSHLNNAKSAYVNPGTAQATKLSLESTQLTNEDKIAKLEHAKEGVKVDFNGVVTEVSAGKGQTLQAGTKAITLANMDEVQITVQVSKSDLPKISLGQKVDITANGKPYDGEITQISGNATKNSNGVPVVDTIIKLKNPDSDLILGVEASTKIHAQHAENTVILPYECILTDAKGDYVYVLDGGVVTRRDVTIGITTSTEAQILEGLKEGEKVISTNLDTLTEGTQAVESQS